MFLNACKIVTAAALLLHSMFGCSLHHASACCMHGESNRSVASATEQDVCESHSHHHHDHDAHCHDAVDDCSEPHRADSGTLVAEECCCEHEPCEGNHGECHSEVECSFVPPSGPEFSIDYRPIGYATLGDLGQRQFLASFSTRNLRHGRLPDIHSAPEMCALFCTWQL